MESKEMPIKKELEEFLLKHNALDKFKTNVLNCSDFEESDLDIEYCEMGSAFYWDETQESWEYWNNLEEEYYKV